jgi:hypothetical protein
MASSSRSLDDTQIIKDSNFFTAERMQALTSGQKIGFARMSTAALNAPWYAPNSLWDALDASKDLSTTTDDEQYTLDGIIAALTGRAKNLDEKLLSDLTGDTGFRISKLAFRDLGKIEASGGQEWQKDIFNLLLLDRLLWVKHCIENPDSPIPVPVQIPHHNAVAAEPKLEKLVELEKNWPDAAVEFAEGWRNKGIQLMENESAVKSLCLGMKKSGLDMHMAKVSRNFCQVALAIRATFVVSYPVLR